MMMRFGTAGSSPLTWGKHLCGLGDPPRGGLIPAHVGKTVATCARCAFCRAHPRSRGENFFPALMRAFTSGSSPLTWGKRATKPSKCWARGLIPAHVGKTPPRRTASRSTGAHPRSRGENPVSNANPVTFFGSSPLTWGKPPDPRIQLDAHGLIPAHVGKTVTALQAAVGATAHPRSRGENARSPTPTNNAKGSSPLTWGKRPRKSSARTPAGLIPAHVGKTSMMRVRKGTEPGSSPLTWGKRWPPRLRRGHLGLIPAHVGKTQASRAHEDRCAAHPRSRGENTSWEATAMAVSGSSPLTWGKRDRRLTRRIQAGLIPAHVGKTMRLAPV